MKNISYKGGSAKVVPKGGFLFGELSCLVRIFQANDLGCSMAHPEVGFLLSLQCIFNFYFHFCPQKLVVRTLSWDFKKLGPFRHPAVD